MSAERAPAADGAARGFRFVVERPTDVWLVCRMVAWALALPLLKRIVRLDTLARFMWVDRERKASQAEIRKVVALSRLLARRPPRSNGLCYERSLLAYRFLSQHGADPRLVVAVKSEDGSVTGHAWVTVGGAPVGESEALDEFVPLVVYGRGGLREE